MVEKDCVFCKIMKKEIPTEFIYESENFVAFLDINPETEGHTLIVPKKHYENIIELPSVLGDELLTVVKKIAEIRLKEKNTGFNILANTGKDAGQLVNHFHLHLIPRKEEDGLRLCVNKEKLKNTE